MCLASFYSYFLEWRIDNPEDENIYFWCEHFQPHIFARTDQLTNLQIYAHIFTSLTHTTGSSKHTKWYTNRCNTHEQTSVKRGTTRKPIHTPTYTESSLNIYRICAFLYLMHTKGNNSYACKSRKQLHIFIQKNRSTNAHTPNWGMCTHTRARMRAWREINT